MATHEHGFPGVVLLQVDFRQFPRWRIGSQPLPLDLQQALVDVLRECDFQLQSGDLLLVVLLVLLVVLELLPESEDFLVQEFVELLEVGVGGGGGEELGVGGGELGAEAVLQALFAFAEDDLELVLLLLHFQPLLAPACAGVARAGGALLPQLAALPLQLLLALHHPRVVPLPLLSQLLGCPAPLLQFLELLRVLLVLQRELPLLLAKLVVEVLHLLEGSGEFSLAGLLLREQPLPEFGDGLVEVGLGVGSEEELLLEGSVLFIEF